MNRFYKRIIHLLRRLQPTDWFILAALAVGALATILVLIFRQPPDIALSKEFDPIRNRGVLRVGVRDDVVGLSFASEDEPLPIGLEASIGAAVSLRLFAQPQIEYVTVDNNTRSPKLTADSVDIVCAMFIPNSNTSFAYTEPYFTDRVLMMVPTGAAGSPAALANTRIGALNRAGARDVMQNFFERNDLDIQTVLYESIPDMKFAMKMGQISSFTLEGVIIYDYADAECEVLPQSMGGISYAIAVRKEDRDMLSMCNEVIDSLKTSGALEDLIAACALVQHS